MNRASQEARVAPPSGATHAPPELLPQPLRALLQEIPRPVQEVPPPSPSLVLPGGGSASLAGGVLEVRNAEGVVRVRFMEDTAEVIAPRDLKLSAPSGKVIIEAATDVELRAARDVTHEAGRRLALGAGGAQRHELDPQRTRLHASRLEVDARESRLVTGAATVIARSLHATADTLVHQAERYERTATTVVERARDSLREITGLCDSRIGRVRALIADAYTLRSRRTVLVSQQETSIDGERILLG